MNRRDAIQRVALLMGGTIVGANLFLEGCKRPASQDIKKLFEVESIDFIGDLAEAILPKTKTPGAKEAGVGEVIPVIVRDCYTADEQKIFMEGLATIDTRAKKEFGSEFQKLEKKDQTLFVNKLDKESKEYNGKRKEQDPPHFFTLFKQLTLLTFFSSKLGATEVLRYVKIPGKYDGDFPYQKGDRAWAT
ncbi:gluconate 2-dehydrogenase subunit 3 family protein [Sphingobacterium spiritivorum]|uniref:gluconate 2-dehydrogenase subunit 3 family protein n=1 Tax=Sphingobacterium spiritivorum TaxID=258 RepID=UPI003DA40009